MPDDTVYFCALDIDEPDVDSVEAYLYAVDELEIPVYLKSSRSKGFHLWHFFSDRVKAASLDPRLEIFPKQDALLDHKSVGNYINLPLFGEDVTHGRTMFLNRSFETVGDQWKYIDSMETIELEQLAKMVTPKNAQEEPERATGTSCQWHAAWFFQ